MIAFAAKQTDSELYSRYRANQDQNAFGLLFERWNDRLTQRFFRRVRNWQVAENMAQETWIVLTQYDGDTTQRSDFNFEHFINYVAWNQIRAWVSQQKTLRVRHEKQMLFADDNWMEDGHASEPIEILIFKEEVDRVSRKPKPRKPKSRDVSIKRWTADEFALLGTAPDQEIANRLNRTCAAVKFARTRRRILFRPSNSPTGKWSPESIALVGTMPDRDLAKQLGRTMAGVARKRFHLKIPAFQKMIWARRDIALLGTASDTIIGKRLKRSRNTVQRKRIELGIRSWISERRAAV